MSLILIRYGELALKSHKVRPRFEEHLIEGISRQFERYGLDYIIEREQGRIFLHTSDGNLDRAIDLLTHIPGVFSVSEVTEFEITNGMETILDSAEAFAKDHLKPGQTFAVRARRAGSHAFTSQEAAALTGERILDTIPDLSVKMKDHDVTIFLEIRGRRGYLFTGHVRGMGGLPPGSQGKVILLLSGLNSMVAGILMMKRGCKMIPVHFSENGSKIQRSDGTEVSSAFSLLSMYDPGLTLRSVEGDLTGSVILELMRHEGAQGVVTGTRFDTWPGSLELPAESVFHPLIGLDDEEIHSHNSTMEEFHRTFREPVTQGEDA